MTELDKANATLTQQQVAEFVEKPLKQLPMDWRPVVWDFWSQWSHLLPNQLALASRLRHWIAEQGLTLDEAGEVFRSCNAPHRMAQFKFASELLANMADLVSIIVKSRHARERRQRDREEMERWKSEAAKPGDVRRLTDTIGTGGE